MKSNMKNFLQNMQEKPIQTREKTALAMSFAITLIITLGWLGGKNILGGKENIVQNVSKTQVARVSESMSVFDSSKKTFDSTFKEVKNIYSSVKESVGNVFVPFITGIEVYNRE